jgi:oligopeptide/dipeptide ABC transporter ATP-binding protein
VLHVHHVLRLPLRGEAVGESGCGKNVTALSILRLIPDPPGKIVAGNIVFEGRNLLELGEKSYQGYKGQENSSPYTKALLSAIPIPDPKKRRKEKILMGDVPSPVNPPPGCRFHPRCPYRMNVCDKEIPLLLETNGRSPPAEGIAAGDPAAGHAVACHLYTRI